MVGRDLNAGDAWTFDDIVFCGSLVFGLFALAMVDTMWEWNFHRGNMGLMVFHES